MKKSNGDDERRRRTAVTRRRRRQRRQQKFASTQRKSNNERQTINNIVTSLDDLGFQTAWFIQWLFHHSTHSTNRYVYHYSTKPLTTPVPRHHSTTQPLTIQPFNHSPLTTHHCILVSLLFVRSFGCNAATPHRTDVRCCVGRSFAGFWFLVLFAAYPTTPPLNDHATRQHHNAPQHTIHDCEHSSTR